MSDDQAAPMVSRRLALAGLGIGGVTALHAALPQRAAAAIADDTSVHAVTLADLRTATDPDPGKIYFVTDRGRQGPFYYDQDDTSSPDDGGITIVSSGGHRFVRIFEGPIRVDWFGGRADYDPPTGEGTPCDEAFDKALAALEQFAARVPSGRGSGRGLPTIAFSAGNYLFRQPGHAVQWTTGVTGLHLEGCGMQQTVFYLDIPEAEHGPDNHFLINDGRERDALGVVNTYAIDGITFLGVTGTERFMIYADTPGGGVAKRMYFSRCSWQFLKVGFDIRPRVNSDHIRMLDCLVQDDSPEAVFFLSDNPQSQNHDFVDCHFETSGKTFHFISGGNLHVRGCQVTCKDESTFLYIDPGDDGAIGIGNGTYNLTDINPEVRDAARLIYCNAAEANITLVNPRLITGHGNTHRTKWAEGETFSAGDHVAAGYGDVPQPSKQRVFVAKVDHTASAANRPRTGENWRDFWEARYEMQLDQGMLHIRGGMLSLNTLLRYRNDDAGVIHRPHLRISEGCRLVNQIADMVAFEPIGDAAPSAALPRVWVDGCRPYTGTAGGAYGVSPDEPVDVSLNIGYGFDGSTAGRHTYLWTASPEPQGGLPATSDGELSFLVPRGAHIVDVRVVSSTQVSEADYQVRTQDGAILLPTSPNLRASGLWHLADTEESRTLTVTSKAADRRDGCLLVDYV